MNKNPILDFLSGLARYIGAMVWKEFRFWLLFGGLLLVVLMTSVLMHLLGR